MVKHTQTIRRQQPTNCLSVFHHFLKLALEGLTLFTERFGTVWIISVVIYLQKQPFGGVLKICSKSTEVYPCRSMILIKFIKIALRHGCSTVNLLHIFKTPFSNNTSEELLLYLVLSALRLHPRIK